MTSILVIEYEKGVKMNLLQIVLIFIFASGLSFCLNCFINELQGNGDMPDIFLCCILSGIIATPLCYAIETSIANGKKENSFILSSGKSFLSERFIDKELKNIEIDCSVNNKRILKCVYWEDDKQYNITVGYSIDNGYCLFSEPSIETKTIYKRKLEKSDIIRQKQWIGNNDE